jgi:hypothetical protein
MPSLANYFDFEKWAKNRLTERSLVGLFRHLDVDGNGQMELHEFMGVVDKLKISVNQDIIEEVFNKTDRNNNGYLNAESFNEAYNMLYDALPTLEHERLNALNMQSIDSSSSDIKGRGKGKEYSAIPSHLASTLLEDEAETYILGLRYGFDQLKNDFIFELYRGSLSTLKEKIIYEKNGTYTTFDLDRLAVTKKEGLVETSSSLSSSSSFKKSTSKLWRNNTLDILADLVRGDTEANRKLGSNIMWWIDIATKTSAVLETTRAFGMNQKVQAMMHSRSISDKTTKSRVFLGDRKAIKSCTSLSLFVEASYVKNYPVVDLYNTIPAGLPPFLHDMAVYVKQRTAFMYTFSNVSCETRKDAVRRVFTTAKSLGDLEPAPMDPSVILLNKASLKGDESSMPMNHFLNISDTKKRVPGYESDNVSIHMLRYNEKVDCVLTYRKWDDESDINSLITDTPSVSCRAGIVGRLLSGVRCRLRNVILNDGVAIENSEVADSSSALASLIIEVLHEFSRNSIDKIGEWASLIESDMTSYAVDKHGAHLWHIRSVLQNMKEYVSPFHSVIRDVLLANDEINARASQFIKQDTEAETWRAIVYGCTVQNKIGTADWLVQVDKQMVRAEELMETYKSLLALQEISTLQFFTIFTALAFPVTLFVRYWTMNFDNQVYESNEGVGVFWMTTGFFYLFFLLLAFHFKLIL